MVKAAAGLTFALLGCFLMSCRCAAAGRASSESQRREMVKDQIEARGVSDPQVLRAMREVPRELFVPSASRGLAYADHPLAIGYGQTISQPYVVAYMTEALRPRSTDTVLEVGTGSGYQAAVLSRVVRKVYTIEILKPLALTAESLLKQRGYRNVTVRVGDGYRGWPEAAPFDGIMVTAAPDHVPAALVTQLKVGGRLVMPVGRYFQSIIRITKTQSGVKRESLLPVRFVPMTGEAQKRARQR